MPSWNIHTAHVERLLASEPCVALGIADEEDFLFGNLIPDIYVGYMVPDISRKITYHETHLAGPGAIPSPDASQFYERYVRGGVVNDLTLGAWTHLLCDHYYNLRTREFIAVIGVEPGDQMRIRKQHDFDLFGRTLGITRTIEVTPRLMQMCASFSQYPIDAQDAEGAVRVQAQIVGDSRERAISEVPAYSLLTPEFFLSTFNEVDHVLRSALHAHTEGEDPTVWGRA